MTFKSLFAAAAIALSSAFAVTATPALAAEETVAETLTERSFDRADERLRGSWSIETREDGRYLVFADNFNTASGPDLKIFLSKQDVNDVRGRTATNDAIKVSALKSPSGAQEYKLPESVNLADYTSILIHCEQFSHFWGGANL